MHLFFDLDGTLTDSSPGIIRCINHALEELGRERVADDCLLGMIGAPLTAILATLLGSTDVVVLDRAVAAYRTRFNDVGIFENAVFPGIAGALDELHRSGHALQIVTAKPAVSARRVIAHFGLTRFFNAVHGPALADRSCDKSDLVGAALQFAGGDTRHAMMIGDRAEDVLAARAHDVAAVAVGWGYGSRLELIAAGPDHFADNTRELIEWVQSASFA
jgi:phosphoglycolate phosphatase